ncbi:biopolymer transport protein ExbD [Roseovarius nanhaiticus]|uniref:Biopolymer transport protein ExbD n=1 Tax=Roseovarius nanhaiticus TaxID=573024 RepID=A0A1N7G3C7_9RHOB|nr:biopolymer transporter ExbD [Roseovarius nanhaiticus]SEK38625.1 biopolymer transport protein ExbD [Roseovarius nanhaiticus]SIS07004.1 biopolymer transport protein ExbD [Roseovarius nanhaiticus]
MRARRIRSRSEPTIALINIVFLMLIFFMISGTLARPLDPALDLVRTADLEGRAPPDALVIHADGRLSHRDQDIASAEAYISALPPDRRGPDTTIRIVPDRDLPADIMVDVARALSAAGAARVMIVTERGLE